MRHIWGNKVLHRNLRMRLYKSIVCSILTRHGLTPRICASLNGANTNTVSKITGRTTGEEAADGKRFDLVKWIRTRRLQWLGHILRMGTEHKIKQTVFEMFRSPKPGDMLMDSPQTSSWSELYSYGWDKEYWKERVRTLHQPRITTVTLDPYREAVTSPIHSVDMTCWVTGFACDINF